MSARSRETLPLIALKSLLYVAAVWLYLRQLASGTAQIGAMIAVPFAALLAAPASRRLRAGALLLIFVALAGVAWGLSEWLLDSTGLWMGIPPKPTLVGADVVFFAVFAFAFVFTLRALTGRARLFSVFEAIFVIGAVVYTFADHQKLALDQPRFFSDWVFANGLDPQVLLRGLGAVVAALSVLMLLETDRLTKLISSLATLLLLGWAVYALIKDVRMEVDVHTGGVGLTKNEQNKGDGSGDGQKGEGKGGQGKGDGEGKSNSNNNGNGGGSSNQPPPPDPVAVSVFHATYEPPGGILYFRQQVLSKYDGHHLVADPDQQFDTDVITTFPSDTDLAAAPVQNPDFHTRIPTSMYLLVDHPQPFGLTSSVEIGPRQNPDPRRFVAAYSVTSLVPALSYSRLVGRASAGAAWTPEQREHYLARPDDPRYEALAEEILRDIDPRFMGEDLMKALMIKRYLEREGFYTRKKTYSNEDDPTAAFLFGDMNGYCVHFAHSAAHLFRSVGIAARVAIGYAVDTRLQGGGSTVLIMADRAHAWPEIHVDGVGWITFDIYPERSDEVPQNIVSRSLESMLGELARDDKSAGKMADPNAKPFEMPWAAIGWGALLGALCVLLLAYAVKLIRLLLAGRNHRYALRATLDRFADVGLKRQFGETREGFARRLAETAPSLQALTAVHLRAAYGGGPDGDWQRLSRAARQELWAALPWHRRLLGALNPSGWIYTR